MYSTTQKAKITFPVSDVERGTEFLRQVSYREAIEIKLGGKIEACSLTDRQLLPYDDIHHPLLMALAGAFALHHPVALSPDMFWLLICQGFAQHVGLNSEKLRNQLVAHDGKKTIEIQRDDFIKGRADNPWPEAFTEFSRAAQEFIRSDLYSVMVPSFSTTTAVEKAAFEVAFMDAMSSYFEWRWASICGIPEITLEGTPEDWQLVRENAQKLAVYDLDWWIDGIVPLLSKIEETARGNVDREFWQSIYKHKSMSGGPFITGWILKFFPYQRQDESYDEDTDTTSYKHLPNSSLPSFDELENSYLTAGNFPSGISKAPFKWKCFSVEYNMEFLAGFVGIHTEPGTHTLRPEIGWVVREKSLQ